MTLDALLEETEQGVGAILVLNEQCSGCLGLVEQLEQGGYEQVGPLAVIAKEATPDFTDRLRSTFPVVIVDADASRTKTAGIVANPTLLVIDTDYRVVHREFGGNITNSLARWNLVRQDLESVGELPPLTINHVGAVPASEKGIA